MLHGPVVVYDSIEWTEGGMLFGPIVVCCMDRWCYVV